ncbi:MAG: hypothetical protein JWN60_2772 [Acidobacteria bacterium]|jgi:DNA repair exonuclease SbcCD ATPase subunit|nr:hypothetical protein [Acidobacteriota bacterium]
MNEQNAKNLAEKIALFLQENEKGTDDFNSLRSSIEKISERLAQIENKLDAKTADTGYSKSFTALSSAHPSQAKYLNLEELADDIIANLQNEKACPYEPTGKPCDHCSMCNSHGF